MVSIILWAAFKWEEQAASSKSDRWLLFIALMLGLSVSVHIMSLAVIFPITILFVVKRFGADWKRVLAGVGGGIVMFFILQNVLVRG